MGKVSSKYKISARLTKQAKKGQSGPNWAKFGQIGPKQAKPGQTRPKETKVGKVKIMMVRQVCTLQAEWRKT
jgi:hypothetical protein